MGFRSSALTIICLMAACGDDASSSGVAGGKLLSEVTDAEAQKLCKWVSDNLDGPSWSPRELCLAQTVPVSASSEQCETAVEACVSAPEEDEMEPPDTEDDGCASASASDIPGDCAITVSEFEACSKDALAAQETAVSSLSCDNPGAVPTPQTPDSCKVVLEQCPALLGS